MIAVILLTIILILLILYITPPWQSNSTSAPAPVVEAYEMCNPQDEQCLKVLSPPECSKAAAAFGYTFKYGCNGDAFGCNINEGTSDVKYNICNISPALEYSKIKSSPTPVKRGEIFDTSNTSICHIGPNTGCAVFGPATEYNFI